MKVKNHPLLSIIVPAFNAESYIEETLDSILAQNIAGMEIIVVNDGSADSTKAKVEKYKDSRIQLINNDTNLGAPTSRNKGILCSTGEYISIHDSDDLSLEGRFVKQLAFMKNFNLDFSAAHVRPYRFKKRWTPGRRWRHFGSESLLKLRMLFDDPFVNSTVVFKRELLTNGRREPYLPNYDPCDDYEYYSYLVYERRIKFAILPEVLVYYRQHSGQLSEQRLNERIYRARKVRELNLARLQVQISDVDRNNYLDGIELQNQKLRRQNRACALNSFKSSLIKLRLELFKNQKFKSEEIDRFILLCWYETITALCRIDRSLIFSYWLFPVIAKPPTYLYLGFKVALRGVIFFFLSRQNPIR